MAHNGNLSFLFDPQSIAVVGATDAPGKISRVILESLRNSGYPGRVLPVNPRYSTVAGLKCYPSVEEVEGTVDLALYAIPAGAVPEALRNAAGKVRGAVIVGGGFAETGGKGAELERELTDISRSTGIRVVGPNCMGIYDTASRVDTFFIPSGRIKRPGPGGLSIISQSGSFAVTAIDELATDGIGVARVVSYGNRADLDESDCLEFLSGDPHTKAVAIYVESVRDGRRFIEAAERCAARKPVAAVKAGREGAGIAAARSHTGAIAGRHEIYRAAFKKAGVIELGGYEEFMAACKAFGLGYRAWGKRVMIITDGGGIGAVLADACNEMGLEAAALPEDVAEELKPLFPPYFSISNPLDLTGSATDDSFALALEKTMKGDAFDIAIVAPLWGPPALTERLPSMLAQKPGFSEKPIIICTPGGEYSRERMRLFREAGLPVFPTPEGAVRAASVLARGAAKGGR